MEKKLQKIYVAYYNLMMAQNLRQARYQILSIVDRNKSKFGHNNKKCRTCRIKFKNCDCFLE